MDPDLAMQRLLSGLMVLGGALVIGALATWLVGWLCRRSNLPRGLTALAQVLTPVVLFYGASLYLDAAGNVAPAQVAWTEEQISYGPRIPGAWSRSFWARVDFTTPDGPTSTALWVDEATYDALRPGSAIDVRYLSWIPFIARPADQSTRALVPWRWLAIAAVVLTAAVALWRILRVVPPAVRAVTAFGAVAFGVVWLVFPTPWETPLEPPILTATAEVRGVRTVTTSFVSGRSTGSVEAPQPWDLVELHFVPQGRDQPVVAIDGVDVGSVPGLAVGARFPVSYSARDPRNARLPGARTYRWREWLELGEYIVAGIVVVGGFLLLGKLAGFWWRKLTQRT